MTSATWGAVCRPKHGQSVSGDIYFVQPLPANALLLSIVDGLGGGEEAAKAARGAVASICAHPERPLQELIQRAHTAIQGTRGAVIGLLRVDLAAHLLSYVGVGNIGFHAYSVSAIKPISKNGILGYRMPSLLELTYTFDPGDTFVLYSDGISARFSLDRTISPHLPPQALAEAMLEHYGKTIDDATALVLTTPKAER